MNRHMLKMSSGKKNAGKTQEKNSGKMQTKLFIICIIKVYKSFNNNVTLRTITTNTFSCNSEIFTIQLYKVYNHVDMFERQI